MSLPILCCQYADGCQRLDRPFESAQAIEIARDLADRKVMVGWLPEIMRHEALLWIASGDTDRAEAHLRKALQICELRKTNGLALRSVIALYRLLRDTPHAAEARSILDNIHSRFTEGHDTADLREAVELLRNQ